MPIRLSHEMNAPSRIVEAEWKSSDEDRNKINSWVNPLCHGIMIGDPHEAYESVRGCNERDVGNHKQDKTKLMQSLRCRPTGNTFENFTSPTNLLPAQWCSNAMHLALLSLYTNNLIGWIISQQVVKNHKLLTLPDIVIGAVWYSLFSSLADP